MAKKYTKKTINNQYVAGCSPWLCCLKKVMLGALAAVGVVAIILWVAGGIQMWSYRHADDSPAAMAEVKAAQMTKSLDLNEVQKTAVNNAWLRYFNNKEKNRNILLSDMKSALAPEQYTSFEARVKHWQKRGVRW